MRLVVITLQNDLIVSSIIFRSFIFDSTIQFDNFLLVAISSDRFLRFQDLKKFDTLLIPPYRKHKLTAMNICIWLWRACFTWKYPYLLAFRIVVINLLFLTCDDTMKKTFLFVLLSKILYIVFRRYIALSIKSCGSQFPFFWTISIRYNRFEMHCWVTFHTSANCVSLWHGSSSSITFKSSSSNLFGVTFVPCFPSRNCGS